MSIFDAIRYFWKLDQMRWQSRRKVRELLKMASKLNYEVPK